MPVTYLPFDVLAADGEDVTAAPHLERRAALSGLGHELHGAGLPMQILPHWEGVDGALILKAARNSSMEGAIVKKVSSHYLSGQGARSWRKVLLRNRTSGRGDRLEPGRGCAAPPGRCSRSRRLRRRRGSPLCGCGGDRTMAVRHQLKEKRAFLERRTSPLGTESRPRPSTGCCAGSIR